MFLTLKFSSGVDGCVFRRVSRHQMPPTNSCPPTTPRQPPSCTPSTCSSATGRRKATRSTTCCCCRSAELAATEAAKLRRRTSLWCRRRAAFPRQSQPSCPMRRSPTCTSCRFALSFPLLSCVDIYLYTLLGVKVCMLVGFVGSGLRLEMHFMALKPPCS